MSDRDTPTDGYWSDARRTLERVGYEGAFSGAYAFVTKEGAYPMLQRSTASFDEAVKKWALVEAGAPYFRRICLLGVPGTGKSFAAATMGLKVGRPVYGLTLHADMGAAELKGHFLLSQSYDEQDRPIGSQVMTWADGPVTACWRDGGRLVLNEIDKAGDDALSLLLNALDDLASAQITISNRTRDGKPERLTPHPDFTVWATMNGELDDLPPALADRFPVSVRIDAPHPKAIEALPADLRGLAKATSMIDDRERHIGLRSYLEYARLREVLPWRNAAELVFGPKLRDILSALEAAAIADPR